MNPGRTSRARRQTGFTLIELILVMALLVIIISLVSPQLSSFFRGRSLDNEARRLMTLTRYAQNRAVAEGIPMILWLDADNGRYGLEAQPGYLENNEDDRAVEHELAQQLTLEVGEPITQVTGQQMMDPYSTVPPQLLQVQGIPANYRYILINPDGFINELSPEMIRLGDENPDREPVVLGPARNWQSYEVRTNNAYALQR